MGYETVFNKADIRIGIQFRGVCPANEIALIIQGTDRRDAPSGFRSGAPECSRSIACSGMLLDSVGCLRLRSQSTVADGRRTNAPLIPTGRDCFIAPPSRADLKQPLKSCGKVASNRSSMGNFCERSGVNDLTKAGYNACRLKTCGPRIAMSDTHEVTRLLGLWAKGNSRRSMT